MILILTYHSIAAGPPPLCVSPARLESDLDLLTAAAYTPLSLSRIVDSLEHGHPLPRFGFALTFDDGYDDFRTAALPILERRGLPATLFVTAAAERGGLSGGAAGPLVPLATLPELADRGVEIGAHSLSHRDLTRLDDAALDHELRQGRDLLAQHAGRPVAHFAYPFGYYDERVRAAAGALYRSAVTTHLAALTPAVDLLALPRLDAYYLGAPLLRFLLAKRWPQPYLRFRRWLRRLRGTERPV